jgi:hypothetical protein
LTSEDLFVFFRIPITAPAGAATEADAEADDDERSTKRTPVPAPLVAVLEAFLAEDGEANVTFLPALTARPADLLLSCEDVPAASPCAASSAVSSLGPFPASGSWSAIRGGANAAAFEFAAAAAAFAFLVLSISASPGKMTFLAGGLSSSPSVVLSDEELE